MLLCSHLSLLFHRPYFFQRPPGSLSPPLRILITSSILLATGTGYELSSLFKNVNCVLMLDVRKLMLLLITVRITCLSNKKLL